MPTQTTAITPSTVSSIPVTTQMAAYEEALGNVSKLKAEVTKLGETCQAMLKDHAKKEDHEGTYYWTDACVNSLRVYDTKKDDSKFQMLADAEGYHFWNIEGNSKAIKQLEADFPGISEYFTEVSDRYNKRENKTVDEKETKRLRNKYKKIAYRLRDARAELETAEETIANTERYIDTLSKVANISAVSAKTQK